MKISNNLKKILTPLRTIIYVSVEPSSNKEVNFKDISNRVTNKVTVKAYIFGICFFYLSYYKTK